MITNEKSYRTAKDNERKQKAASTVSRMQAARDAASASVADAEAAAVQDPDAKGAFDRARAARKALEEADQDLSLATQYQARVEAEVAAAEREAIQRDVALLESRLTEVVDEEALDAAVEIAARSTELYNRMTSRIAQRRDELSAINALRARIGATAADVPTAEAMNATAAVRLGEVGLSAQRQLGLEAGGVWPHWSESAAFGLKAYLTGTEDYHRTGADANGAPIYSGIDKRPIVREATAVLDRVLRRRAATETGKASVSSAVRTAASVAGVVLAAVGLSNG